MNWLTDRVQTLAERYAHLGLQHVLACLTLAEPVGHLPLPAAACGWPEMARNRNRGNRIGEPFLGLPYTLMNSKKFTGLSAHAVKLLLGGRSTGATTTATCPPREG